MFFKKKVLQLMFMVQLCCDNPHLYCAGALPQISCNYSTLSCIHECPEEPKEKHCCLKKKKKMLFGVFTV